MSSRLLQAIRWSIPRMRGSLRWSNIRPSVVTRISQPVRIFVPPSFRQASAEHPAQMQTITFVRRGWLGDIVAVLHKMLLGPYPPPTPLGMPLVKSLKMNVPHAR